MVLVISEPIDDFGDIVQIVEEYQHRWIIEELHKVWKTGCRVEGRLLQSIESVETMMAITLPIAGNELQCLWQSTER